MQPATARLQPSGKVFVACGFWLVALGAYFLFLRPALLPEDPRYIGSSIETIRAAARSVRTMVYDRASGGTDHCQMGVQSLWQADLFDWIAARIDSAGAGQRGA